ncbi:phage/plasmid primase, P4 family, C-terminal domain-containing protein [Aromatoleum tolulyticum]|uniref:Phage/plasmid primase, P4 family, C-terminal domain-containing protein n=1 Tax=Aromatoleum tolulyticum TaxID=34027 RepID=A0A1N6VUS5_9RHOO|nr:phage/plasmid primase, P4 family [Aromatoleum tolulyticum]SIQ81589.1 phage/plasmid primase, P4 family, C-terminal domain-containing protein [Aromatoleum tolulyticum]
MGAQFKRTTADVIDQARATDLVWLAESYGVKMHRQGKDFFGLCPFHSESSPSFTVYSKSAGRQRYHCMGCGADGDPIQFVQEYEGVGFRNAVKRILGELPASGATPTPASNQKAPPPEPEEVWTPIYPVPASAPNRPDILNRKIKGEWHALVVSRRWAYRNQAGEVIGYVCRFDLPGGGKEVMPQVWAASSDTGECRWRWQSFSKPRPMYGLDKLAKHPNAQVLAKEGEKAADAAQQRFVDLGISLDKLVVVSWPGGGKAVKHVDFSPLAGRSVGLWPDADQQVYPDRHERAGLVMPFLEQPGTVAMLDVWRAIRDVASVKLILPPEGVEDGWDLADPLPAGFSLLAHIKASSVDPATLVRDNESAESESGGVLIDSHALIAEFERLQAERADALPVRDEGERSLRSSVVTYDKELSQHSDGIVDALLQHPTQDNVALVFRRQFEGQLLYAHSHGKWFEWDGTRWAREETDKAFNYAREIARRMNTEGKSSLGSASFCKGVEQFARADRAFAVAGTEFDTDNYLLNTPAGIFDLRTNTMRPHDQRDRITKSTEVSPIETGGERFLRFLHEITGGDASLAKFLQVSLGACLSGAVESHWMLFWTGTGRNGKNSLGDLVMYIMGDYAKKIPSSTLMAKSYEAHPTEIANLQGARLAVSSEVADGDHWDEARINELTGDETLSARFMRGDFFDFRRTHKHLIFGNHRPQLRTTTDALKSRIKIVPFRQSFKGREDPTLPARLRDEAGFVLYWLLQGHAAWIASGRKLPHCAVVEEESEDYFASQSTVEAWVSERIITTPEDGRAARQWPRAGDLFHDYQSWKQDRGEQPISQTRWGETMAKLFKKCTANGIRYVGAVLKPR